MNIQFVENPDRLARIKVLGIGGAGGNAVNRMIEAGLTGVEFHAVNTDAQALKQSRAHQVLAIGSELTRGLGAGGNPAVGREAAEADRDLIARLVDGADMVFVTAGMGGGTGTGAAPVAAAAARAAGALTVAIVTKPFLFEGDVRRRQAEAGIAALREEVDTLIVIPNQRLLEVVSPTATMQEAFRTADEVLYQATRGIYEIIARPAIVNLDFADVRTVMKDMGVALVGTGHAAGDDRAVVAARAAIASPLLEDVDIRGAQAVLVNLVGAQVTLQDTAQAMQYVQDAAGPQAHIIFGYGVDDSLSDELQVTVIATGFPGHADEPAATVVPSLAFMRRHEPAAVPAIAVELQAAPEVVAVVLPDPEPAIAVAAEPEPVLYEEPALEPEPVVYEEPTLDLYARDVPAEPEPAPIFWPEPAPEPARELEPVLNLVDEPRPELATILARLADVASPPLSEPEPERWAMAAAAGESESRWRPQSMTPSSPIPAPIAAPETESSLETSQRFLRPVGSQDLRPGPRQNVRGDSLIDDLNAPAYTRKYMD
jgi:cell division protein FtsZ